MKNEDIIPSDYDTFSKGCVEELKDLQAEFQKKYDLTWYEDWSYNQTTGLLTFSTGDKELNFKYFEVGSYSEKSQTWMWSWNNDSTLVNVKERSESIRGFGLRSNFNKLTEGHFPSEEAEGWEFTAIAAKLENGIGAYRPVSDGYLQIFMVLTEYIDNEVAQKIKNRYVECGNHEYRRRAFVCRHLNSETKTGFQEAVETYEDMDLDDLQAWCDECEIERQKDGEWNDASMAFAQIKLVCEKCYFEMKEANLGYM
jgi:hypothetical protein